MRYGMKIEIDCFALEEIRFFVDKARHHFLLESAANVGGKKAGVCSHIAWLWKHVQSGENAETGVAVILPDMTQSFAADQFERQKAQAGLNFSDLVGFGKGELFKNVYKA